MTAVECAEMRSSSPLALPLFILSACSETGVAVHMNAPDAAITVPADGAQVDEGVPLAFAASVGDRETATEDLAIFWSLEDGSSLTGDASVTGDTVSLYVAEGLAAGDHTVSLVVTDADAGTATDSIALHVLANTAPSLTFGGPEDGAVVPEGQPVAVDLLVADDGEDDITAVALEWPGGESSWPTAPTSDGHASFYLEALGLGDTVLTVIATDTLGASTSASVILTVVPRDADGDGHDASAWGGEDCDDAESAVHPDATEMCNGADDDCDGATDEDDAADALPFYADADEDSFGDAGAPHAACALPAGHVTDATDCDDADATIHPSATEFCNGADDDCDGTIDEDEAADALTWYADSDVDAFGDPGATTLACTVPLGFVGDATDCDDAVASTYPGADETCNGADDNCDGTTDETTAVDALTWYADADADTYGDAANATPACSEPAGYTSDNADCDDADADVSPADTELCNGIDDDCDAVTDEDDAADAPTWYADADGDSYGDAVATDVACDAPADYVSDDDDCDDEDATVHPGAIETCDAANEDEDCNGLADDDDSAAGGASTWYVDEDADGYGGTASTAACDQPLGYVASSTDCDDGALAVHPGASESCNSIDDDCDTLVDDDDTVTGGTIWYQDADSDGYGGTVTSAACAAPLGYVNNDDDCDDTRGAASPAASEACATVYDDNCDGTADEAGAVGCATYYADGDSDAWGSSSGACLCAATAAYPVENDDDCDDTDDAIHPDAEDVCEDGVDDDCDGVDSACAIEGAVDLGAYDAKFLPPERYAYAGQLVAAVGDLNDDGTDDLGIGSWYRVSSTGTLWLLFSHTSGTNELNTADVWINGTSSGDSFSHSASGGQDVNNDGVEDVIVGASASDVGGTSSGAAYVFYGEPTNAILTAGTDSDHIFEGSSSSDYLGFAVAIVGDMDGDAYAEVAMGAYLQDSGGSSAGAAYVYYGPLTGTHTGADVSGADARLIGEDGSDYFGYSVDDAGDVDGDGNNDIIVGAMYEDAGGASAGAAYVFTGGPTGVVDASTADLKLLGESSSDAAGNAVSGAGDTDGDGYADVVIGAYKNNDGGTDAGALYVVTGNRTGTHSLATVGVERYGTTANDYLGWSLDAGTDIDADGYTDLVAGAYGHDATGSAAGAAYVYYGPLAAGSASVSGADAALYGEDASDYAGYSVAMAGDANDDGFADLLIGAMYEDEVGYYAGAAYLLYGGAR